jgi:hypothetical protein
MSKGYHRREACSLCGITNHLGRATELTEQSDHLEKYIQMLK